MVWTIVLRNGTSSPRRTPLRMGQNRAGCWPMDQKMKAAENVQDVARILVEGYSHVTMGATAMNERSSRGHTLITLKVRERERELSQTHIYTQGACSPSLVHSFRRDQ